MEDKAPTIDIGRYQTKDLGELFSALTKAQASMSDAKTESRNPHYRSKYADLSSVVKASRGPLTDNGLAVTQFIREKEGKAFLFTRLGHTSGQWIDSFVGIHPPKADIQTLGSYLTYLRRYSYAAITGVVTTDDDDGESSMEHHTKTIDGMADFEKYKT